METVIRLEGLTKYYGKQLGIADLNLSIRIAGPFAVIEDKVTIGAGLDKGNFLRRGVSEIQAGVVSGIAIKPRPIGVAHPACSKTVVQVFRKFTLNSTQNETEKRQNSSISKTVRSCSHWAKLSFAQCALALRTPAFA